MWTSLLCTRKIENESSSTDRLQALDDIRLLGFMADINSDIQCLAELIGPGPMSHPSLNRQKIC